MDLQNLLQRYDFRFNKGLGQNFLSDDLLLEDIVRDAGVTKEDCVLEIGAGAGTLTRYLARAAKRVVACEIDGRLREVLRGTLAGADNVEVKISDVMKWTARETDGLFGGEKYKVVANIPYYITSPLILKFTEECENVLSLTLTVQKEVADRLCAEAGTKAYGALTVAVGAVADVRFCRLLDKSLFYPVPKVDSAVVHVAYRRDKFRIADKNLFRRTVKAAFAMRRKTLVNNLLSAFGCDRADAEKILRELGIGVSARGETLSVGQFVRLADALAPFA